MFGVIEPIILCGILKLYMKNSIPKMFYLVPMELSQRKNYIKKFIYRRACIPVLLGIPGVLLVGCKIGLLQMTSAVLRLIVAGVFISEMQIKITHWVSYILLILSAFCVCVIDKEVFLVIPLLLDLCQIPFLILHSIERRRTMREVMTYENSNPATGWNCNL